MNKNIKVITANFDPFKLVIKDSNDYWSASLDEINTNSYDYEKLNEISTKIDIGLNNYSLLICYDGTLLLPMVEEFSDPYYVLSIFNKFLTSLLLGGEYCEAILPEDLGVGLIDSNNRAMIITGAEGKIGKFHKHIKSSLIGLVDAIRLHQPQSLTVEQLKKSYEIGSNILLKFNEVDSSNQLKLEQLLFGVSFYNRKQLPESLVHFWISTERLIEYLWNRDFKGQKDKITQEIKQKIYEKNNPDQAYNIKWKWKWTASNKIDLFEEFGYFSEELAKIYMLLEQQEIILLMTLLFLKIKLLLCLLQAFEFLSLAYSDFKENHLFDDIAKKLIGNFYSDLHLFNTQQVTYEVTGWEDLVSSSN